MNSREYGDGLEDHVIFYADEYHDIKLKKYTNSGAKNKNDSDFYDENFQFECKRNGTKTRKGVNNLKFSVPDWNKVQKEARSRNKKPIMVNGCDDLNKSVVTLRLKDFMEIYEAYIEQMKE